MKKSEFRFSYEEYDSIDELPQEDAELLREAKAATNFAYAPYSHFHVGAAARLSNGNLIKGANQENASFPVGLCAERVLLSTASSLHPNVPIDTVAISYNNTLGESGHPIAPCGLCRQSLQEFEDRMNHPIRVILGGKEGKVYVIPNSTSLLPFAFTKSELK